MCKSQLEPIIESTGNTRGAEQAFGRWFADGLYRGLVSSATQARLLVGRGKKKSNFAGFSGTNSRGKWPISREFRGNFEASFAEKWLVKNGRFRGSFPNKFRWKAIGFALIWGTFSMKLDAFTQASYRNMKSYFTMIKTNKRIRILKTHLPLKLPRRVSSLSNCMLLDSPSKFCLRRFFTFLTSEARFSAL